MTFITATSLFAVATVAFGDDYLVVSERESDRVQWIRAVHSDGWIWYLKDKSWRAPNEIVDGDPLELNDYAMRRPDGVHSDDTEQMIEAIKYHERRGAFRPIGEPASV